MASKVTLLTLRDGAETPVNGRKARLLLRREHAWAALGNAGCPRGGRVGEPPALFCRHALPKRGQRCNVQIPSQGLQAGLRCEIRETVSLISGAVTMTPPVPKLVLSNRERFTEKAHFTLIPVHQHVISGFVNLDRLHGKDSDNSTGRMAGSGHGWQSHFDPLRIVR